MRFTKHRKEILDVFKKDDDHLWSAESIYQVKQKTIDLSTIYRTLDVFSKAGIIHKSMIDNTAHYYLNGKEHHHYMICTSCHRKYKIKCPFDDFILNIQKQNNFKTTHHELTIYGICESCNKM